MTRAMPSTIALILAVVLCAGSASAQVTDYYVANGGKDSNLGTQAQPWATITHAGSALI